MSFNPALLNQNSVKKFVDRLEKVYAQRLGDKNVKRTQVYEDVAHLFGYDSWHNMDQAMKNAHAAVSDSESSKDTPQSAVLHLLQNTQLPLTDTVVQTQLTDILRTQSTDEMLQSCREISRFISHNNHKNENLILELARKIQSECPDHFHETREEIIKIFSGIEFSEFLLQTSDQKLEENKQTQEYLSAARVVMKRLDYIPRPFESKRKTWTFPPLAAERLTSLEQIDEVLKKLKSELKKIPDTVKNSSDDIKRFVKMEVIRYVYGEYGVLYRAHNRYPENAKYEQTSKAIEKALGLSPNAKLKNG